VFDLVHCRVLFYEHFVWTEFPTGEGWGGTVPEDDPTYRALAERLGYGGDIYAYCREHDFLHSFVEQEVFGRPSPVLWSLAHGWRHPDTTEYEEALVQAFQAFLRGNIAMTATSPDRDWWAIRQKAYNLLGPICSAIAPGQCEML
jgi:hypothetical protein